MTEPNKQNAEKPIWIDVNDIEDVSESYQADPDYIELIPADKVTAAIAEAEARVWERAIDITNQSINGDDAIAKMQVQLEAAKRGKGQ